MKKNLVLSTLVAGTFPLGGLEAGSYEFQLQVTDDNGLWATDNIIVSVGEVDPCFGCWDY